MGSIEGGLQIKLVSASQHEFSSQTARKDETINLFRDPNYFLVKNRIFLNSFLISKTGRTMYLFFSSDAHDLFKKGILHTLSYPVGYCEHYRYEYQYLPEILCDKKSQKQLIGKEGVILYAKGNNINIPEQARKITFFPVRKVIIQDIKDEPNTGLIHFFLEVGSFVSLTNPIGISKASQPPYKFVAIDTSIKLKKERWFRRVQNLVRFDLTFQNTLFFSLRIIASRWYGNERVRPRYNSKERSSYFKVSEGRRYVVEIALYNSAIRSEDYENFYFNIVNTSDDLVFSNLTRLTIGTDKDNRSIKFSTKVLKTIRSSGSLIFQTFEKTTPERMNYEIDLRVEARKTIESIAIYSTLASFAVASIFLVTYSITVIKDNAGLPWAAMIAAVACSIISSAGLFYFFNKN